MYTQVHRSEEQTPLPGELLGQSSTFTWQTDEDNRTPPSFPASIKELLQEGHSGESQNEAKALGKRHDPAVNIYKICHSSTVKRSGATVEDVTPGYPHGGPIHSLGQGVGRADYSRWDTHGLLAALDIMKLLPK